jgi:hypothetical protein
MKYPDSFNPKKRAGAEKKRLNTYFFLNGLNKRIDKEIVLWEGICWRHYGNILQQECLSV